MDKLLFKLKPFTLLLLALIAGCSSGPTGQQSSSVPGPVSNLATVYFYRTHTSLGAVMGVDLKDNGIDIGTSRTARTLFTMLIRASTFLPRRRIQPQLRISNFRLERPTISRLR
jgi:hypothetical protein